jgi:hydroxymethylglutaryl-CoA lyase
MFGPNLLIKEVILRDGLQNISQFIPTSVKVELFRLIVASGVREVEITSFVNPRAVSQFSDAAQMARTVLSMNPRGVTLSALVPNLKGAQDALKSGLRKLGFVMSVSESHNIANVRRTIAESLDELRRTLELKEDNPDLTIMCNVATVFGCPFEGQIKPEVTLKLIRQFYELGIRNISLADTVGFGNPKEVKEISRLCLAEFPDVNFGIHLHNTRGLGLANAFVAYENGIRILDGAIGGLGGCPFAPGARGNTSTEDLVFMFEEMGISTGVNMEALLKVSQYFKKIKSDICFTSSILEAGMPFFRGPISGDESEQKWLPQS